MNGTVRTQLNGIQFNNPGGHLHLADLIFLVGAGSGDGVFVSGDTTTRATAFIERVTMNGPAGTFNARVSAYRMRRVTWWIPRSQISTLESILRILRARTLNAMTYQEI